MKWWIRSRQFLLILLSGGALLQTTAGCEEVLAPLVANLVSSLVLNALLGGLAT